MSYDKVPLLTYYYPHFMAVVFLIVFLATPIPNKAAFLWRALLALLIATFLAHVNRIFLFVPEYRLFPSGHMTFCLGVSISMGMLRPWTLAITLPLLVPFGMTMVAYGFHSLWDVLGAVPLVLVVYWAVYKIWPRPPAPPLDRATVST